MLGITSIFLHNNHNNPPLRALLTPSEDNI